MGTGKDLTGMDAPGEGEGQVKRPREGRSGAIMAGSAALSERRKERARERQGMRAETSRVYL